MIALGRPLPYVFSSSIRVMSAQKKQLEIPALKVHQWQAEWDQVLWGRGPGQSKPAQDYFYLFVMSAAQLKRATGIQRRAKDRPDAEAADAAIQRAHDTERSAAIRRFVKYGGPYSDLSEKLRESKHHEHLRKPGWLPTAIILNILPPGTTRRGATLARADAVEVHDDGDASSRTAHIVIPQHVIERGWRPEPGTLPPFEVIDGQHRLWAFSDQLSGPNVSESFELPVVAFNGLDSSWQAYLFHSINVKPKRINQSLAFDLYPLLRNEEWLRNDVGQPVYREARAQELVEVLWTAPSSPWAGRINTLGLTKDQLGDPRPMVTQAAWVRSLMATYVRGFRDPDAPPTKLPTGLFGTAAGLEWSRAQQAAFLIRAWQCLAESIRSSRAKWIQDVRSEAGLSNLREGTSDPAFDGPSTLLTQDQGVRGVLFATNDVCSLLAAKYDFATWVQSDTGDMSIEEVQRTINELRSTRIGLLLDVLSQMLATFDWRTANAKGLDADVKNRRLAYRGSGGYRLLRGDLFAHLAGYSDSSSGSPVAIDVAEAAARLAAAE